MLYEYTASRLAGRHGIGVAFGVSRQVNDQFLLGNTPCHHRRVLRQVVLRKRLICLGFISQWPACAEGPRVPGAGGSECIPSCAGGRRHDYRDAANAMFTRVWDVKTCSR